MQAREDSQAANERQHSPMKGNAGLQGSRHDVSSSDTFFPPISLQDSRRVRVSSSCALEYDKFMYIMYMYILVVLCSLC
jgi:hypothetical protein